MCVGAEKYVNGVETWIQTRVLVFVGGELSAGMVSATVTGSTSKLPSSFFHLSFYQKLCVILINIFKPDNSIKYNNIKYLIILLIEINRIAILI